MRKAIIAAIVLVAAAALRGQVNTASLSGTARDESGAVLPGVAVAVRNLDTGIIRDVLTDQAGNYRAPALAPGTYEISASLAGFKTEVARDIKLAVGQVLAVDLVLKVGQVAEKVLVTGQYHTVETANATLSGLVDDKKIRDLPLNARSFVQLAFLQPGVVEFRFDRTSIITGRGPKMNVSGQRPSSNSFLLDGTYVNDAAGRTPGSTAGVFLGIDTVREFRVLTSSFSAEYGLAAGGVVNAITKSGTNEYHGSAFWFQRNDDLDARNFFDLKKPEFRRHQFGFTTAGPIQKEKTFFFGAGEWFRQSKGITQVARVPSPAARQGQIVPIAESAKPYLSLFPFPNGPDLGSGLAEHRFAQDEVVNESFFQGRVDHAFSPKDLFFVRYTFDDSTAARSAASPNPLALTDELARNQYLTLEYTKIVSPRVLNTARLAFNRTNLLGTNRFLQQVDPSLAFVPGHPLGTLIIGGIGEWGPERRFPNRFLRNLYSFQDDFAYQRGRHFLKYGLTADRFQDNNINLFNADGAYNFPSVLDFLKGTPDRFETLSAGSAGDRAWRQWLFGFYAQDDFKATSRLTLNFGLRYDFVTVMTEAKGRVQNLRDTLHDAEMTLGDPMYRNPSLRDFAPRFGFAWDPFGSGKTAVRGAFGLFFDPYLSSYTFPGHILAPPFLQQGFVQRPTFPRNPLPASFPNRIQNIQLSFFNATNPYSMQYNLNVQREIYKDFVFTLGYSGSRGVHLMRGGAVNIPIPQIVNNRKFFPMGSARRNPNWSDIDLKRGDANSWYNALQASAQKRFSNRYQLQVSYTYSKTMDEGSGFIFNDTVTGVSDPQDPDNRKAERGQAAFDVRHNLTFNYTYDLPSPEAGFAGKVLGGWQLNGITAIRAGMPFTVGVRADRARALLRRAGQTRPDLISGASMTRAILGNEGFKKTGKFYDPFIFTLQAPGFLGNVGRNTMRGPDLVDFDFSLVKNTRLAALGEGGNIQLRIEFFNLFNRVNFAPPDPFVFAGTATSANPACPAQFECPLTSAGRITGTATDARQLQLGLKIMF